MPVNALVKNENDNTVIPLKFELDELPEVAVIHGVVHKLVNDCFYFPCSYYNFDTKRLIEKSQIIHR